MKCHDINWIHGKVDFVQNYNLTKIFFKWFQNSYINNIILFARRMIEVKMKMNYNLANDGSNNENINRKNKN